MVPETPARDHVWTGIEDQLISEQRQINSAQFSSFHIRIGRPFLLSRRDVPKRRIEQQVKQHRVTGVLDFCELQILPVSTLAKL